MNWHSLGYTNSWHILRWITKWCISNAAIFCHSPGRFCSIIAITLHLFGKCNSLSLSIFDTMVISASSTSSTRLRPLPVCWLFALASAWFNVCRFVMDECAQWINDIHRDWMDQACVCVSVMNRVRYPLCCICTVHFVPMNECIFFLQNNIAFIKKTLAISMRWYN